MAEPNRSGLSEFLRSRRARLTPEQVGLPLRTRRRTPGLRREEVAELAGIGVDWYVRLEQGRTVHPSADTVDALAQALRLDEVEHDHLRALAREPAPSGFVREQVPDTLRHVVEHLDHPAYLTGRRWDLLVCNDAAVELFGDIAGADANLLCYLLLDPAARTLFDSGWAAQAQHVVAQFRAAHDRWAPDPAFTGLSARLREHCPEFADWWEQHEVLGSGAGRKTMHHPVRGRLDYEYATFQANQDPALRLTIYTPAG